MSLRSLFRRYANTLPQGKLTWIGVRSARKEPLISLDSVMLGHCDLYCKILKSGTLKLGDPLIVLNTQQALF